jgi:hypothetical protein
VTDEFIANSYMRVQKIKVGRGVGGYRILLKDIVATPSFSSPNRDRNEQERDNKPIDSDKE